MEYNENELAREAVDICYRIHLKYGPGLFESIYEEIFCYEWSKSGIEFIRQGKVHVVHENTVMGIGFVPDIIVGKKLILEFKSVEALQAVHFKQLVTYLRLTNLRLGLLINFNVPLLKDGIHRMVNGLK